MQNKGAISALSPSDERMEGGHFCLRLKFGGNAPLAPDPLRRGIRFSHGEIGHRYIFNNRSIPCASTPEPAFYNETEFCVQTARPIIRRTHHDLDLHDPLISMRPRQ